MKNILYIILICPLILLSCDKDDISDTQSEEFVKFYTGFPEFTAADVAVTDEGFAVTGTAKILEGEEDTWICLLRTDKFGNSLDSVRKYGISEGGRTENKAFCIKALSDGGFGILGSVHNNTGFRSVYFIRTDEKGDTLFTRTISLNGDLEAKYFDVSTNGSFFMTGYFDEPGNNRKQMWWFGIDSQGNDIRNQRTAGYEGEDECTHLVLLPDGGLLISGFVERPYGIRSYIIRTDENTLALRHYEIPSSANEKAECVLPLDDNSCMLLTTSGNTSGSIIKLQKIDLSAIFSTDYIIWEKSYASSFPETGKSIMMDDQFIYILGTSTVNSSNTLITLLKTDLSGNEVERMNFGSGSRLSASAFKRTEDGGFVITGTNAHPEVNNTAAALIKTK